MWFLELFFLKKTRPTADVEMQSRMLSCASYAQAVALSIQLARSNYWNALKNKDPNIREIKSQILVTIIDYHNQFKQKIEQEFGLLEGVDDNYLCIHFPQVMNNYELLLTDMAKTDYLASRLSQSFPELKTLYSDVVFGQDKDVKFMHKINKCFMHWEQEYNHHVESSSGSKDVRTIASCNC